MEKSQIKRNLNRSFIKQAFSLVPGTIGALLALFLGYFFDFVDVEAIFSDMRYRSWVSTSLEAEDSLVTLILVDGYTLNKHEGWPITPAQHTHFLKRLLKPPKGCERPQAVAFDLIFEDFKKGKLYQEHEIESFTEIIRRAKKYNVPVITSFLFRKLGEEQWKINGLPSKELREVLDFGYVNNAEFESGGKVRYFQLRTLEKVLPTVVDGKVENVPALSLGLMTLKAISPPDDPNWEKKVKALPQDWQEAWDGKRLFPLSPPRPPEKFSLELPTAESLGFPNLSYGKVLEGVKPQKEGVEREAQKGITVEEYKKYISGKVLVVCVGSHELGDRKQLKTQTGEKTVPGGMIHGIILQSWLSAFGNKNKKAILPLNQKASWFPFAIFLTIIGLGIGLISKAWRAFGTSLFVFFGYLFFTWWMAKPEINWEIPIILPLIAFLFSIVPGIAYGRASEERMRRKAITQMKGLTAPEVVERLMADKSYNPFRLERCVVTFLIGDLRSFTAFSELCSPEQLGKALQRFLDPLIEVAVAHKGTVWQIAGDEIKVCYNAPEPLANHELAALESAAEMIEAHRRARKAVMNEEWWPVGEDGEKVEAPYFGFGVASGEVAVGFMGSKKFSYYTAYGMAINIASRLCGKAPGEVILTTPQVKDIVGEELVEKDEVLHLKGVSEVMQAYRLKNSVIPTYRYLKE